MKNPLYKKTYAEKLLMLYPGQTAPMHYHWNKMEDLINRGGNDIYITVYNGSEDKKAYRYLCTEYPKTKVKE